MTDPLDAQERARQTMESVEVGGSKSAFRLEDVIAEQIRQAEQAAREKALEEAINVVDECGDPCNGCKDAMRALKEGP